MPANRLWRTFQIEHFHRTQTDAFGVRLADQVALRLHLMSDVCGWLEIGNGLHIREAEDQRAQTLF